MGWKYFKGQRLILIPLVAPLGDGPESSTLFSSLSFSYDLPALFARQGHMMVH